MAHQSYAASEGLATWYLALVLNQVQTSDENCEIPYFHGIDWDNDGDVDTSAADPHDCYGDPFTASPVDWVGSQDWLAQSVANDTGGGGDPECSGSTYNKGTEYEWVRYFWEMISVHDQPIGTMWDVWRDAEPHNWDPDNSTTDLDDDPGPRMDGAAGGLSGHATASANHRVDR